MGPAAGPSCSASSPAAVPPVSALRYMSSRRVSLALKPRSFSSHFLKETTRLMRIQRAGGSRPAM
eukprot:12856496-Alexandrium_andersonii.AAC.1